MKSWIKSILYVPKHYKPTDENIRRLLVPSFLGIILCMICLAGTTWAWFTASVQTQPQTIAAANYDITVTVNDKPVNGAISLTVGESYKVTLTATGTANEFGGYCIVKGGEKPLYTAQLLPGGTLSFTLIPEKDGTYTFAAVWGKHSGEADIKNGSTIGQKPKTQPDPEIPETQQPVADGNVYTVQSGDSLWEIAQQYGTTVEELAAYNNIVDATKIQVGQKIKIPPADYEIPNEPVSAPQQTESQPSVDEPAPTEPESAASEPAPATGDTSTQKSESSMPSE